MMSWESIAISVTAPVLALTGAVLALRRQRSVDRTSEKMGAVTESRAGQAQLSDDQQDFIGNLQQDNALLRTEIRELKVAVQNLTREVNRLYRKHGENGETPPRGTPRSG